MVKRRVVGRIEGEDERRKKKKQPQEKGERAGVKYVDRTTRDFGGRGLGKRVILKVLHSAMRR